jgi:hypothetical protein
MTIKSMNSAPSTVRITLGATLKSSTGQAKYQHIHGEMRLELGGRVVPYMGYFGPEDVCLNSWVVVLNALIAAFKQGDTTYVFDEGEQGQPAYRFERDGETAYLSIVDSALSDGVADPDFQRVPFRWFDLEPALKQFGQTLLEQLALLAPSQIEHWKRLLESGR